jgi:isopentenyl diphosphate isomerase/L-lactate dehydrogenase-like FMN-dependent dehydrogenase
MATGVDDDGTLRANREGFSRFHLRPRRLVDVSSIDMSVELFGERWNTPILLCPAGRRSGGRSCRADSRPPPDPLHCDDDAGGGGRRTA